MCTGSTRKADSGIMEAETTQKQNGLLINKSVSLLLELAATDDISNFKHAVEEDGYDLDAASCWYGKRIGSKKKMGYEERTPLMVAAMFGSKDVLSYILQKGGIDVNRACGSDGATALHCATAGGCGGVDEIIKLLIDASADVNSVDVDGNRPLDVISPCVTRSLSKSRMKVLETMLEGSLEESSSLLPSDQEVFYQGEDNNKQMDVVSPKSSSDGIGVERKEYPVDPSLPDIKNGIYGTDEFRMFTFKVKPCSRAYSHDWTECPFVHPGENARRRDPRKYHYSCVPCPEFRKGSCPKADACEYAHGIFECWLHPAQYRTRLCKDEINCARRVCFFAHKPEELRPLYASTGSAVPSPRSYSAAASLDMGALSPIALGSPSMMMPSTSTPPMTPTGGSSPLWQSQLNITPPTLQLSGSRLKAALHARDMDLETELLEFESQRRRHQLLEEIAGLSSPRTPTHWNNNSYGDGAEFGRLGGLKPAILDDTFGSSMDPALFSQLHGLSLDPQLHSPEAMHLHQSMNQQQLRSSYSAGLGSSPVRSSYSIEQPGSPSAAAYMNSRSAAAYMNSRSAAFATRSQSFVDRSAANRFSGMSSPVGNPASMNPAHISGWGSPNGKLDWTVQGDELNKLRKSASFGIRSNGKVHPTSPTSGGVEPDVSWAQSTVNDAPKTKSMQLNLEEQKQYHLNGGGSEIFPPWVEQMYMEQEQMVA